MRVISQEFRQMLKKSDVFALFSSSRRPTIPSWIRKSNSSRSGLPMSMQKTAACCWRLPANDCRIFCR